MRIPALLLAAAVLCAPSSQAAPPSPLSDGAAPPPRPYGSGDDLRSALKEHFARAKSLALHMVGNVKTLETGALRTLGYKDINAAQRAVTLLGQGGTGIKQLNRVMSITGEIFDTAISFSPGTFSPGEAEPDIPPYALFTVDGVAKWIAAIVDWSFDDVDTALDADDLDLSSPGNGAPHWTWALRVIYSHFHLLELAHATTQVRGDQHLRSFLRSQLNFGGWESSEKANFIIYASKLPTVSGDIKLLDAGQYADYDAEVEEIVAKLVEGGRRAEKQSTRESTA